MVFENTDCWDHVNEESGGEIPTANLLAAVADELTDLKGEPPTQSKKEKIEPTKKTDSNRPQSLKEIYLKFVETFVRTTKTKALQEHLGNINVNVVQNFI